MDNFITKQTYISSQNDPYKILYTIFYLLGCALSPSILYKIWIWGTVRVYHGISFLRVASH